MYILDDNDTLWEVDPADCEVAEDGSGFWYLAADGEDEEEFYEFCDVECHEADADADEAE